MKTLLGILLIVCAGCSTINIVVNSTDATVNVTRVGCTNKVTISPKGAMKRRLAIDQSGQLGTVEIK